MTAEGLPYEPALVHVTGVSEDAAAALSGKPAPYSCHLIPRTIVLTADEPVKQILKPDPNREYAILQVFDNTIVLAETKGDAQATQNTGDTTLARPNGGLVPTGVVVPLRNTNEIWAAAAVYPTRISVLAAFRR